MSALSFQLSAKRGKPVMWAASRRGGSGVNGELQIPNLKLQTLSLRLEA